MCTEKLHTLQSCPCMYMNNGYLIQHIELALLNTYQIEVHRKIKTHKCNSNARVNHFK